MRFLLLTFGMSLLLDAARAFGDGPGPVGSEFEVDGTASAGLPRLFPEAGGAFVVVWNSSADGNYPFGASLRRYDAMGAPVTPTSLLNPAVGFVDADRDGAGNFVLVYRGNDGHASGVAARRFDAAGSALAPEFQVNTTTGGGQFPTGVGIDPSGAFMIVWESHAQLGVFAQAFDAGSSPVGGEIVVTPNGQGGQSNYSSVIADGAGNFIVAWHHPTASGPDVFARRYGTTGTALGPAFQVNTYTSGFQGGAQLQALGGGAFLVTWGGEGPGGPSSGPHGQRYDATGTPVGGQFDIASGPPGGGGAVGGEFVVAWSDTIPGDDSGIAARRFDNMGVPVTAAVAVSTYTVGSAHSPQAILHPGGDFTVVWTNPGTGVRGQRIDATGARVPGDVPLAGQRLVVRDRPDPVDRRLNFGTRDPSSVNGITPVVRPDTQGMYLHVYNAATGDSACMPLPASGWDTFDDLDDPFFYRDPANANGPCHKAKLIRNKRFSANCRGAGISYTLGETTQGSVAVAIILGNARYCTVFGGTVAKDSGADGAFKARNSPRPATCPAPPVPCP